MTTRDDIRGWLKEGQRQGASHVIVACDMFDYSDFPVYVLSPKTSREEVKRITDGGNGIMECYNLSLDLEEQLARHRCYEY